MILINVTLTWTETRFKEKCKDFKLKYKKIRNLKTPINK